MGTVLIIDGELGLTGVLTGGLVHAGHEVFAVVNGENDLQRYKSTKPSVVICDLSTPTKSGFTTIYETRRCFATTPIIAVSSVTDTVVADHARRCGASFCVPIEFDAEALETLVSGVLAFRENWERSNQSKNELGRIN